MRQISRSHVISRFRPDLLPSLHKVTQMRHTFRQKNSDFVTFRAPGWRLCSFLYARNLGDPLNCWKTQKTASKLVSYFQEGDTNTKIWSASRKRVVLRWHLRDFELLVQYTGNKRPNLKRFFAFSNTPVGGIGNVHKKLRLSSVKRSKNNKIRFFWRKVCLAQRIQHAHRRHCPSD